MGRRISQTKSPYLENPNGTSSNTSHSLGGISIALPVIVWIALGGTHFVRGYRAYRAALPVYQGYKTIKDVGPGVAGELGFGDQQIGIDHGTDTRPLGEVPLIGDQLAGMPEENVPVPWYEVQLSSVPKSESRTVRSKSSQQIGALAVSTYTGSVAQKKQNKFRTIKTKMIPRKGSRCPNGYRYDYKKKMCVLI